MKDTEKLIPIHLAYGEQDPPIRRVLKHLTNLESKGMLNLVAEMVMERAAKSKNKPEWLIDEIASYKANKR